MRTMKVTVVFGLLALIACGCPPASTLPMSGGGGSTAPSGTITPGNVGHDAIPAAVDPIAGTMPAPAVVGAMTTTETMSRPPKTDDSKNLQSGLLTAGSFDDNLNPKFFSTFVSKLVQNRQFADLPGKFQGRRVLLTLKDSAGNPVGNARVQIASTNGTVDLISRTDGRVVILSEWDRLADGPLTVTVTPDGGAVVKETVPANTERWEITVPSAQGRLPQDLDLAIVLDTTGSMGDEHRYLKAEIKGIAAAIREKFPQVNQRYALIVYRDDGDEYVTRRFDFTASLDEFRNNLGAQSAGGGGDIPEAVHKALEDSAQLRWREGHTARVLFLIGDAPPHSQFLGKTLAAADALRKRGVSLYPVACSGYDDSAEFVFRASALMSGGQFLFLTDDSGVGNAHGEPHIPFYHVQKLDQMMVRMIADELSGKRIAPEPGQILRTVGRPPN